MKLDRSIVTGLEADEPRAALIAGMGHFARSTGMRLVAEGVETEEELAALRRLNVDLAQGYLLGRPEPVHVVRRRRARRDAADAAPRRSRRHVRGTSRAGQRRDVGDAPLVG